MSEVAGSARPVIAKGLRLQWEAAQEAHVLLYPEGMVKLNSSAGAILSRCDGVRTVADIVADLERSYGMTGLTEDVQAFVVLALEKRWLELRGMSSTQPPAAGVGPPLKTSPGVGPPLKTSPGVGPPLWLLLELTYRCPLHCVFCYNPTEFARTGAELGDRCLAARVARGARARRGAARAVGR